MGSDAEKDDVTSVLIVGVGGQGVIMVSKVLATLCQEHGLEVKQSEVHGMAKRGGAVFSHVRFGKRVHSPVIPAGEADVLLALEWAEGLRWLHYLDPEKGTFISDVRKIAAKLGNERAANTVLLGILSTALKFSEREWLEVIERLVPPKTREINRAAFLAGREWVNEATVPEGEVLPVPEVDPILKNVVNRLEITEAWCKGCDICVKFCPERCLALNESGKVVVKDADACTGCRLCEMLCPDFAIRLHKELPAEVAR